MLSKCELVDEEGRNKSIDKQLICVLVSYLDDLVNGKESYLKQLELNEKEKIDNAGNNNGKKKSKGEQ